MRTKIFIIGALLCACITACSQKGATNQSLVATYHGTGVVESVDREKGRVKINHENIKGYMDAMTMNFKLKDAKLSDGLNVGDKIDFTLEDVAGIVRVTEIKKR